MILLQAPSKNAILTHPIIKNLTAKSFILMGRTFQRISSWTYALGAVCTAAILASTLASTLANASSAAISTLATIGVLDQAVQQLVRLFRP